MFIDWDEKYFIDWLKDPSFYLELEFLQCELMVRSLGDKQESFNKSVVDVCIKHLKINSI